MAFGDRRWILVCAGAFGALAVAVFALLSPEVHRAGLEPPAGWVSAASTEPNSDADRPRQTVAERSPMDGGPSPTASGAARAVVVDPQHPVGVLHGRVLGRSPFGGDPKALPGASVRLAEGDRVAEVATDRDGRYRLAFEGRAPDLLVQALDHLPRAFPELAFEQGELQDGAWHLERDILLEPAASLVFAGAADVELRLWRQLSDQSVQWAEVELSRSPEGFWRAGGLHPGEYAYAGVGGMRSVPLVRGLVLAAGEARVVGLTSLPAASLSAHVVDGSGRGVGNATVRADLFNQRTDTAVTQAASRSAVTDATGRVELHGLLPGTWRLDARAESGETAEPVRVEVASERPEGEPAAVVQLRLRPSFEVLGRVVDPEGGAVGGALVWIYDRGAPDALGAPETTALDGTFRLQWPQGRPATVRVDPPEAEARRWGRFERDVPFGRWEPIDLGEIALLPLSSVAGRLQDPSGAPIEGASIAASHPRVRAPYAEAVSDGGGHFALEGVPGDRALVRVHASGFLALEQQLVLDAPLQDVLWTLRPAAAIDGRAVDGDGAAAVGVLLHLHGPLSAPAARSREPRMSTIADSAGRFRFEGLVPGRYRIETGHLAWRVSGPGEWILDGGVERAVLLLEPSRRDARASLSGFAVDAKSGAPLAVALRGPRTAGGFSQHGSAFRWTGLQPGTTGLSVHSPGFRALELGPLELRPGQDTAVGTVALEPGLLLLVEARNRDGSVRREARVALRPAERGGPNPAAPELTLRFEDGYHRTDEAAPGSHRLIVRSRGRTLEYPVELPRAEPFRVDLP